MDSSQNTRDISLLGGWWQRNIHQNVWDSNFCHQTSRWYGYQHWICSCVPVSENNYHDYATLAPDRSGLANHCSLPVLRVPQSEVHWHYRVGFNRENWSQIYGAVSEFGGWLSRRHRWHFEDKNARSTLQDDQQVECGSDRGPTSGLPERGANWGGITERSGVEDFVVGGQICAEPKLVCQKYEPSFRNWRRSDHARAH